MGEIINIRRFEPVLTRMFYMFGYVYRFLSFKKKLWGDGNVLCYHRILPPDQLLKRKTPLCDLIVSTKIFEDQIRYLSNKYQIITLDNLYNKEFQNSKHIIVITFDDGYVDNLNHALPILEKYNVPATIYITTKFPEGDGKIWWFELWDILSKNESLNFRYNGQAYNYDLTSRFHQVNAFHKIRRLLLTSDYHELPHILSAIRGDNKEGKYLDYMLNWEQIKILDQHPLITIAAHTHNHENLKQLQTDEIEKEMKISKDLLESKLNHPIHHFAYPYGTPRECGDREWEIAGKAGFKTAVTTYELPLIIENLNMLSIPRLFVPNIPPSSLEALLLGWGDFVNRNILSFFTRPSGKLST